MSDPRTIGRYEIVSELGHGAMGAVFLARDPAMDRTVAVKTILSGACQRAECRIPAALLPRGARRRSTGASWDCPRLRCGRTRRRALSGDGVCAWTNTADAMKKGERLKIDVSRFPPALAFTIEMNGRLFYKGTAGNKADYDNLYVPPGVHEFRITVSAGSVQKSSNTVSTELVAKKHFTLKTELRPQPSAAAPALVPATQVVATLKMDRFQF